MKLNKKLFNGIYEIYDMNTDTIKDIVVADSEYEALPNGNEHESACNFFDEPRTLEELRMELKEGNLELRDVIKSGSQLFFECFCDEEYDLVLTRDTKYDKEYVIVEKEIGVCAIFNISNGYNVFDFKVIGNFLTTKKDIISWNNFILLTEEMKVLLWDYGHDE